MLNGLLNTYIFLVLFNHYHVPFQYNFYLQKVFGNFVLNLSKKPVHRNGKDFFVQHSLLFCFQAAASPEPVYDLSDCGLKNVPAGVYTTCKIQRKEALLLQVSLISVFIEHLAAAFYKPSDHKVHTSICGLTAYTHNCNLA